MNISIRDASVPVFIHSLGNMRAWLDKAAAEGSEAELMDARLAPDMRPLPAQFQMASDSAKGAIARMCGLEPPPMADTEASFDDLRDRCDRTIAFIEGVDPAAFPGSEGREIELKFPNGMGYRFTTPTYLFDFALPNFFFHVTTAYAILRNAGISLGKPDFLRHLGPPNIGV